MPNSLLEIGVEEVPARFVDDCITNIQTLLEQSLSQNRLNTTETQVRAYGTYRRFAFIIEKTSFFLSSMTIRQFCT